MARPLLRKIQEDEHELLDWAEITKALCSYAFFSRTQDLHRKAPEIRPIGEILTDFDILDQLVTHDDSRHFLAELFTKCQLPSSDESFQEFKLLPKGKVFSLEQIHLSALIIEWSNKAGRGLRELVPENFTELFAPPTKGLQSYLREVRSLIDSSGSLNFSNHPELKRLEQEKKKLESTLRSKLQELIRSDDFASRLQHDQHDVIHDRYVLAVRSDSYKGELGFIVAKSASGHTLFVEPFPLREISNKRIHILAQIEEIIEKICQSFSERLSTLYNDFSQVLESVFTADDYLSRAEFISKLSLTRPEISQDPKIDLIQCYHPLLDEPVRNDIHIFSDSHGLMISGPNTGGKTVLLKSIAISYLFFYKGLFVPAKHAQMYPFKNLFFFSHDHQNLSKGLSSFASEVLSYLNMLDVLTKSYQEEDQSSSLIVIDEIFNSTSSEEASSLAMSLLEKVFSFAKTKVFISTHHKVLKTLVHQNKLLQSAHMEFNLEKRAPTYKIQSGTPGSSLAFEIFENLANQFGDFQSIAKRAKDYYQTDALTYENLLKELSEEKSRAQQLSNENEKIQRDLKRKQKSAEGLAHLEKQKIIDQYEIKFQKILKEIQQIKEETKNTTSPKGIEKKYQKARSTINQAVQEKSETLPLQSHHSVNDFSVGDMAVYLINNKKLKILGIDKKKDKIQVGQGVMRFWVSPTELKATHQTAPPQMITSVKSHSPSQSVELDGRGMRLQIFQEEVESRLNELITGDLPYLSVIHGHGEGILKNWLRSYLKKRKEFNWTSPQGNDGCTEIKLS